ncbi:MAG: hypothetical protein K2Q33_05215 [Gammaproteobacteria bacterium]|nr:hypothetical protein [Gammaproteobacteria bacterium]
MSKRLIVIDPSYEVFYQDKLFQEGPLNRDDSLLPLIELKRKFSTQGVEIHTADYLDSLKEDDVYTIDYYSMGIIPKLNQKRDINYKAYLLMEPPIVQPKLYEQLPILTEIFDTVYVHNTHGDGYSLENVDQSKLRKFYWPQTFAGVLPDYWNNQKRQSKIVVVNGKHKAPKSNRELYSHRINAMAALAKDNMIDLYGRGWEHLLTRNSLFWSYIKNYRTLMRIYRGACDSKYEVLSRYQFSLCFENMIMDGYVTEKIFDCLYVGTIPIYWGAPDISDYVPSEAFIDFRNFSSYAELSNYIKNLSDEKISSMRMAGRSFLESDFFYNFYYKSLESIIK